MYFLKKLSYLLLQKITDKSQVTKNFTLPKFDEVFGIFFFFFTWFTLCIYPLCAINYYIYIVLWPLPFSTYFQYLLVFVLSCSKFYIIFMVIWNIYHNNRNNGVLALISRIIRFFIHLRVTEAYSIVLSLRAFLVFILLNMYEIKYI
jgi:hypothetical protein